MPCTRHVRTQRSSDGWTFRFRTCSSTRPSSSASRVLDNGYLRKELRSQLPALRMAECLDRAAWSTSMLGISWLRWCVPSPRRREAGRVAQRAVGILCEWAFREIGMARLEFYIEPGNAASRAVAERVGLPTGRPAPQQGADRGKPARHGGLCAYQDRCTRAPGAAVGVTVRDPHRDRSVRLMHLSCVRPCRGAKGR